jgi:hypothetical protein
MFCLLFNRFIKPNKGMKNQERIEFNQELYNTGLYDAYINITNNPQTEPFEITSIRNGMAIGWVGNIATSTSIDKVHLLKRPRKVWVHIIESPDGVLTSRVTDYQEVTTYKGNTIVKQIEVEI